MNSSRLDAALQTYAARLADLEQATPRPSAEQILDLLAARDGVESALANLPQESTSGLLKRVHLDERLQT
jgi:predicted trehalose synthase